MANDPRDAIIHGNIMRIDNAFVESTHCFNKFNGYILISFSPSEKENMNPILNIRLNINRDTLVLNPSGQKICPCCIKDGSWVNIVASSRMTRSIPPQSNAYLIVVQEKPQTVSSVTTDRIAFIDPENNFLYTGNPNDINSQVRFVIMEETSIRDQNSQNIDINELRPGQRVRVTHANFQTASIPPQTTAFDIQLM